MPVEIPIVPTENRKPSKAAIAYREMIDEEQRIDAEEQRRAKPESILPFE